MAERPAKRARRTDSAAMWEKTENTVASTPKRPLEDSRNSHYKDPEHESRNDSKDKGRIDERKDDRRRRSRSRDRYQSRKEKSRSRERPSKGRDRDRDRDRMRDDRRDRDRVRDRDHGGNRRESERSRSPDRYRSSKDSRPHRVRDRIRHRSRSRSPVRNGTVPPTQMRSPPRAPRSDHSRPSAPATTHGKEPPPRPSKIKDPAPEDVMQIDSKTNGHKEADEDEDSEDALLRKMMGFSTFKTTQNKKIPGNDVSGVRKEKLTHYRQYMNRTGGFNRPLSPSRD